jgi:hypothetical protein
MILRYFAKKRLVVILTNSEGWKLINPKLYQDFAPPAFIPKKSTPIRSNIEIKYKRNELSCKNLLLVNKIIKNNTREIKKKTICLPIGNDRSKKEIKFSL